MADEDTAEYPEILTTHPPPNMHGPPPIYLKQQSNINIVSPFTKKALKNGFKNTKKQKDIYIQAATDVEVLPAEINENEHSKQVYFLPELTEVGAPLEEIGAPIEEIVIDSTNNEKAEAIEEDEQNAEKPLIVGIVQSPDSDLAIGDSGATPQKESTPIDVSEELLQTESNAISKADCLEDSLSPPLINIVTPPTSPTAELEEHFKDQSATMSISSNILDNASHVSRMTPVEFSHDETTCDEISSDSDQEVSTKAPHLPKPFLTDKEILSSEHSETHTKVVDNTSSSSKGQTRKRRPTKVIRKEAASRLVASSYGTHGSDNLKMYNPGVEKKEKTDFLMKEKLLNEQDRKRAEMEWKRNVRLGAIRGAYAQSTNGKK